MFYPYWHLEMRGLVGNHWRNWSASLRVTFRLQSGLLRRHEKFQTAWNFQFFWLKRKKSDAQKSGGQVLPEAVIVHFHRKNSKKPGLFISGCADVTCGPNSPRLFPRVFFFLFTVTREQAMLKFVSSVIRTRGVEGESVSWRIRHWAGIRWRRRRSWKVYPIYTFCVNRPTLQGKNWHVH